MVERLDVVREPADDDPGPVPLEEAEREALEMAEERVPQVGQDPLARPAREVRLCCACDPVQEARDDEDDDHDDDGAVVLVADPIVEGELGEVRGCERSERRGEEARNGQAGAQLVAAREAGKRRNAAGRAAPGPVGDLGAALHRQVTPGLPDPHRRLPRITRASVGNPPPQPDGVSLTPKFAPVARRSCQKRAVTPWPPAGR